MAYNPAIPQPNQLISNSQSDILANFAAIGATGTGFNFTGGGFTQYPFNSSQIPAPPAAGSGSGIEFTKLGSAGTVLFPADVIPWFINAVGSYPLMPDLLKGAGNDFSYKIGPILVNCGFKTQLNATNSYVITYNTAFANAVIFKSVQPTNVSSWVNGTIVYNSGGPGDLTGFTVGFQVNTTAAAGSYIYYLAIGY